MMKTMIPYQHYERGMRYDGVRGLHLLSDSVKLQVELLLEESLQVITLFASSKIELGLIGV